MRTRVLVCLSLWSLGAGAVLGFNGWSNCTGTGGEDGDGCQVNSCPFAGIGSCESNRPSCSVGLNGSASAQFNVSCNP